MTWAIHVPDSCQACSIFPSAFNVLRRSRRRRPASDNRCACPKSPTISSIASPSCVGRPVSDTGGSAPVDSPFFARWRCWRSRSSRRALSTSSARRLRSCRARRRRRHGLLQVFWVSAADAFGRYQARHSQQRRRPLFPAVRVIHRRSQAKQHAARFVTAYSGVDLFTAAKWISNSPPPKLSARPRVTVLLQ